MIFLENIKEQFFRFYDLDKDTLYHLLIGSLNKLGFDVKKVKFSGQVPVDSCIYCGPKDKYGSKYIFISDRINSSELQRYQMALCLSQFILAEDKTQLIKINIGLGEDIERSMALSILMPKDILLANEIVYEAITDSEEEKWKQLLLGMNISWQDLIDRKKELGQKIPNIDLSFWNRLKEVN